MSETQVLCSRTEKGTVRNHCSRKIKCPSELCRRSQQQYISPQISLCSNWYNQWENQDLKYWYLLKPHPAILLSPSCPTRKCLLHSLTKVWEIYHLQASMKWNNQCYRNLTSEINKGISYSVTGVTAMSEYRWQLFRHLQAMLCSYNCQMAHSFMLYIHIYLSD